MRALVILIVFTLFANLSIAQSCCSGGSGCPVAGGTSQGVLQEGEAEIGMSFQYINTNKFLSGDVKVNNFLDNFNSKYLYTRLGYGLSPKFTLSLETGYFFNKTQVGLNKNDTTTNSGFGDLIIFPRYSIYSHVGSSSRTDIAVGIGLKIPIGKHLDSSVVYTNSEGKKYYTPDPPAIMPTTGSNDFIFYGFLYHGYPLKKFRIYSSLLYIRKGWNSLGQKFGDYASIGLFASQTFFDKLSITMQIKGEWIHKMDYNHNIDMLAKYNMDVESTGGKRLLFIPELDYNFKYFSTYILGEIPLYQYVNGTAIASEYSFTFGVSYKFFAHNPADNLTSPLKFENN